MNCEIRPTASFNKEAKKLSKRYHSFKEDFLNIMEELKSNPQLGTDLGHGFRKIRMAIRSKNKGKSGGARVITFTVLFSEDMCKIKLLYIFDKEDRASISLKDLITLLSDNGISYKK